MTKSPWARMLRDYRKEHGLKQDALAQLVGVNQSTISRWETTNDQPTIAMQRRLRERLFGDEPPHPVLAMLEFTRHPMSLLRYRNGMLRYVRVSNGTAALHDLPQEELVGFPVSTLLRTTGAMYTKLMTVARELVAGELTHARLRVRSASLNGCVGWYEADWTPITVRGERLILTNWRCTRGHGDDNTLAYVVGTYEEITAA